MTQYDGKQGYCPCPRICMETPFQMVWRRSWIWKKSNFKWSNSNNRALPSNHKSGALFKSRTTDSRKWKTNDLFNLEQIIRNAIQDMRGIQNYDYRQHPSLAQKGRTARMELSRNSWVKISRYWNRRKCCFYDWGKNK